MRLTLSFGWKQVFLTLVLLAVVLAATLGGAEYYTAQPAFCGGTCHIMNRPYSTWEKSGHKDIACVDCHYAPGEKFTLHAKFKGLAQLFSYLAEPDAPLRKRAVVKDVSCTTSECHSGDEFLSKKSQFTEKVGYVHKTHFDKTIEGQKLHCTTCHVHSSADKHFEVREDSCYLCHFKGERFNEGRAACDSCHEIPTKSLQSQKEEGDTERKPITHQSLEKAKVPCGSCHYEMVLGKGEIKVEGCKNCHDAPEDLEALQQDDPKKEMHEKHVASQQADCFDCHRPIAHQEKEGNTFLTAARSDCATCHPDHHRFQELLLVGAERGEVSETPSLMHSVKTNCLGCHREVKHEKGQPLLAGTKKACAGCHTEDDAKLVQDWKDDLEKDLTDARDLAEEAAAALDATDGKRPAAVLNEARETIRSAQENLHVVEYGNGVHNKKYSVLLLDAAMDGFDEVIDLLQADEEMEDVPKNPSPNPEE